MFNKRKEIENKIDMHNEKICFLEKKLEMIYDYLDIKEEAYLFQGKGETIFGTEVSLPPEIRKKFVKRNKNK